ncbi:histidine phosphatase family protein [Cellulomonas massiliensis]|uniref:histidine phosphatase family protein n=1 Tax=Cellulomonas massiliensis TaxID=1465811 RepID=UPI0002D6691C|nr:histidine phosphatase family protein [Cellulomonas massiliensis]
MTVPRVLLWRHGRTAYNVQARLQGQVDIPLDEVGRWQARTAAASLLARHAPVRVVASDLSRAVETAQVLGRMAELPVTTDERLRERGFGAWEGLTGEDLRARWPEEFAVWRAGGEPAGIGAESRADVARRTSEAVAEHVAALPPGGVLVVVSHGAAISAAAGAMLGVPPERHAFAGMANCHWTELVAPAGGPWRLAGYNLGPTDASSDWNAGPDVTPEADAETRDPD